MPTYRHIKAGDLVVNVKDYGAVGNGTTDDLAAIEAASAAVTAAGGGRLYFPPARYLVSRAIYCTPNVHYDGYGATIINNLTTGSVFRRAAFMPGYIHGFGFYAGNANQFPRVTIQDVARGATTITASSAGGFSAVSVGDFIAVRTLSHYIQGGNIEVPSQVYFTKVLAKSGDVITMADSIPTNIAGALIHHIVGNPNDGAAVPMRMVENVSIRGFTTDAAASLAGGGCYGFHLSDVIQAPGRNGSLMTLNAMVHFEIARCRTKFSYTFCETALGCQDGWIHDNVGSYRVGSSIFHPFSIVEGSNNIRIERNEVTVGADYESLGSQFMNMVQCRDIQIKDNVFTMVGNSSSLFALAGSAEAQRTVSDVQITGNRVIVGPLVERAFNIGETGAIPPQRFMLKDNLISGELNPGVNEWLRVVGGKDFIVTDNLVPVGSTVTLPATYAGLVEGNLNATAA